MGRKETYLKDGFKRLRRIIFIKPNVFVYGALNTNPDRRD